MKNDKKSMNPKDFRFAVLATDVVLFTVEDNALKVLLIDVNLPPYFVNTYGVPGGLVLPVETADDSVLRHVKSKVGLHVPYLEQLYTFSSVKRDPRGRVVSVAYLGLISASLTRKSGLKDGVFWRDVGRLPKLAYDHSEIVKKGIERLLSKLGYTTIVQFLLPKEFTLPELQQVYEAVFAKEYDKRNFRKKILTLGVLKKTGTKRRERAFRPAELYSFRVGVDKVSEIL
jgi:8-oxo-dGTP diphosphatase